MAITTAMMVAGAVVGGIANAAKGSAARKANKTAAQAQAEENEKARQHDIALKQMDIDRRKNAVGKWNQYEFGAKPLIRRATPAADSYTAPPTTGGVQQAAPESVPGLLERTRGY